MRLSELLALFGSLLPGLPSCAHLLVVYFLIVFVWLFREFPKYVTYNFFSLINLLVDQSSGSMSSLIQPPNKSVVPAWCNTKLEVRKVAQQWTIENFGLRSERYGEFVQSSQFSRCHAADEPMWSVRVFPKGGFNKDYLCLTVNQHINTRLRSKSNLAANIQFSIINNKMEKMQSVGGFRDGDFGNPFNIITLSELQIKADLLLPQDTLTILCEISWGVKSVTTSGQSDVQYHDPKHTLSHCIGTVFDKKKFSDVTLVAGGHELKAHKSVLSARSEVFAAMFEHEMEENKLNRVSITDIDHEVLEAMLIYMYTDKAPNICILSVGLLAAADKYALDNLKEMCIQSLRNNISIENAANVLILADRHNAAQLKLKTAHFIVSNVTNVMKTQGWKELTSHADLIVELFKTHT